MARTALVLQAMLVVVVVVVVVAASTVPAVAGGGCTGRRPAGKYCGLKRLQFQVFLHDQLNVTDVVVAQPKAGIITTVAGPFGTLLCLNDRVTARKEAGSALLGSMSGLSAVASLDGLTTFNALTLALDTSRKHEPAHAHIPPHLRGLHGTLNLLGSVYVLSPQPISIVGGTGSFLFAQGSATVTPIEISTFNQVFGMDIDVYLPA